MRRYVRAHFPERARPALEVWRPPVPAGEEAQVDYGYLCVWFDPRAGRRRRVWAFSMVLRYSRHLFVRPVIRMDQRAWVESHVWAFEFFGGCPRRVVPDNLKAGVVNRGCGGRVGAGGVVAGGRQVPGPLIQVPCRFEVGCYVQVGGAGALSGDGTTLLAAD